MADCIGVLGDGRLQQWGTSHDLYHHPVNRFVADFIGEGSMVSGKALGQQRIDTPLGVVTASGARQWPAGEMVKVLFRPDDLEYDADSRRVFEITSLAFRGAQSLCNLKLPDGGEVLCLVSSQHGHAVGDHIGIRLVVGEAMVFPG